MYISKKSEKSSITVRPADGRKSSVCVSKSNGKSSGLKLGGKKSSTGREEVINRLGNTLTVGHRRERASSLANIYSMPR